MNAHPFLIFIITWVICKYFYFEKKKKKKKKNFNKLFFGWTQFLFTRLKSLPWKLKISSHHQHILEYWPVKYWIGCFGKIYINHVLLYYKKANKSTHQVWPLSSLRLQPRWSLEYDWASHGRLEVFKVVYQILGNNTIAKESETNI
jgi:hypothetical protein